ncbi:MAG: SRPBCC family protein [Anaerolineae bacterium]|jgi:hypothetical protein
MANLVTIIIGVGIVGLIGLLVYALAIRPWYLSWGATDDEVERVMPGDDLVKDSPQVSNRAVTNAVTIKARPTDIWPWLVQMGHGRGGMYSYDWIDRLMGVLDRNSTWEVLPQYQHLEAGEAIPLGGGPSWPVSAIEPNRSLVLDIPAPSTQIIWSYGLYELDETHTRLVLRITYSTRLNRLVAVLLLQVIDPGSFLMTRKHLLGIKQRAEALAEQRAEQAQ